MSVSPWVAVGALGDVMRDTLPDVRVLVVQSSGGAGEAAAAAAEMAAAAAAATKTDTQRKSMSKTQTKAKAKVKVKVKLKTKATAKLQVTTIFRMLKPSRRGGPASAAVARRGHLHRWVRWIIADLAIPLLRSHFYCTETESHRLRVFYYRKGVWVRRCRLNR
jgi:hypothetical protein